MNKSVEMKIVPTMKVGIREHYLKRNSSAMVRKTVNIRAITERLMLYNIDHTPV